MTENKTKECKLYSKGKCKKFGRHWETGEYPLCKPLTLSVCTDNVDMIDPSEMCQVGSIFGNEFYYITDEQLEQLKKGKVIFCNVNNEYMCFVALRKEVE